jgi:hypothetical protein
MSRGRRSICISTSLSQSEHKQVKRRIESLIPDVFFDSEIDPVATLFFVGTEFEVRSNRRSVPSLTPLAVAHAIDQGIEFDDLPEDGQFNNFFLYNKELAIANEESAEGRRLRTLIMQMGGRIATRRRRADFVVDSPAWIDALFHSVQWIDPAKFPVVRSLPPARPRPLSRLIQAQLNIVPADRAPSPCLIAKSEAESAGAQSDLPAKPPTGTSIFPRPGLRKTSEIHEEIEESLSEEDESFVGTSCQEGASSQSQRLHKICDELLNMEAIPSLSRTRHGDRLSLSQLSTFSQREETQPEHPEFNIEYGRDAAEARPVAPDEGDSLLALFASSQMSQT